MNIYICIRTCVFSTYGQHLHFNDLLAYNIENTLKMFSAVDPIGSNTNCPLANAGENKTPVNSDTFLTRKEVIFYNKIKTSNFVFSTRK